MAEEQQVLAAPFPAPPPFFKYFTADNLARLDEIKASTTTGGDGEVSAGDTGDPGSGEDHSQLPPDLRYLVPPAPPPDGKYRSFGDRWDLNEALPTLAAANILQLYPSSLQANGNNQTTSNPAVHLKALLRSTLLSFLELIHLLSINPAAALGKIEDFRVLFLNMHHLINEYRPHQARETLILMMEDQIEKRRAEVDGIRQMRERVAEVLRSLGKENEDGLSDDNSTGITLPQEDQATERSERVDSMNMYLRLWDALEEIEV